VDLVQAEPELEVTRLPQRLSAEVMQLRENLDLWNALVTVPRPGFLERMRLLIRPAKVLPS